MKSGRRREFQVAECAEKTVIGAFKTCAVDGQQRTIRFIVLLAILSVFGYFLDKIMIVGYMQRNAMKAFLHPVMIKSFADAFLKNNELIAPITTFV